LPYSDGFVIRARGQKGTVWRVAYNICILIRLENSIEDTDVFFIRVKRSAIIDDFPNLDASFRAFSLLLEEFFIIRASTSKLILEGMEVNRENTVFEAVPPHFRRLDSHKLAVSLIL
jgi:hypothetical protein